MPSLHVSFEVSFHIIRHTLGKFCHCTNTDTVTVDQFFSVEFIDQRKHIPEKITHFELELIVITISDSFSNLLYLGGCLVDIVFV